MVGKRGVVENLHIADAQPLRKDVVDGQGRLLGGPCRNRSPVCTDVAGLAERLVVLRHVDVGLAVAGCQRRVEVAANHYARLVPEIGDQLSDLNLSVVRMSGKRDVPV